jgi:hypothetical protein
MGAKLGLAFGAEAFDEDWRRDAEAEQLRAWLWSDMPRNSTGEALAWVPSTGDLHPFADPPNHAAFFWARTATTFLTVLCFGTLGFSVPVASGDARTPTVAWRSGPRHGAAVASTYDQLLEEAVQRAS